MALLRPDEMVATRDKITKINARAEKRGFTGKLDLKVERKEITEKNAIGLDVTEVMYECEITGDAPKYDGWKFIATATWDAEAGLITRTAPGVSTVDRSILVEGWCDHCRKDRYRKDTYVLLDEENGTQLQVGSTCIKDFLGWSAMPVFLSTEDVQSEVTGIGTNWERRYSVDTVLAVAWACVQEFGYVPASSYEGSPTKHTVAVVLDPRNDADRKLVERLRPYVENAARQASVIRQWVLSDEFSGASDYVTNLKAVIAADSVGSRNIGLAVSAPQTWAKAQERDLIRRVEKEATVNEWLGAEKDKLELEVVVKAIRFIPGDYGTRTLYTMRTATGHMVKWFATTDALGTDTSDKVWKIKGTVKKLDEYQGVKSTVLTRCKVIGESE